MGSALTNQEKLVLANRRTCIASGHIWGGENSNLVQCTVERTGKLQVLIEGTPQKRRRDVLLQFSLKSSGKSSSCGRWWVRTSPWSASGASSTPFTISASKALPSSSSSSTLSELAFSSSDNPCNAPDCPPDFESNPLGCRFMVSTLCPSPRDAKLPRMIRVLFRRAVLPATARVVALFAPLVGEVCVSDFVFIAFVLFVFAVSFRDALETTPFEFLRTAAFLRELLLLVLIFFLVAIYKVYHCVPAQFTFTADGYPHRSSSAAAAPLSCYGWLTSTNSASHGFRSKSSRATVIGNLNLPGPALPGFIYRMPPRVAWPGLCECPLTT